MEQAIAAAEKSVFSKAGFAARAAAIESLEIHALHRSTDLHALTLRAEALCRRLEAANERFLRRLRRRIASGRYTREGLKRAFARHVGPDEDGYDALDLLVAGLLDGGALDDERTVREPEMVAYQPTPARAILALLERASISAEDVVYDLGSGLGRVVILVALLSGARAKGIELEPAYCEYAARCARNLNVPRVELIEADAREARLTDGTVFFMYTPFRGALLERVLERLRAEARERPIRVCTYGPCTTEVARCSWLSSADGSVSSAHEVAVFHSAR